MDLKINIDSEAVEQQVTQAVLDSSLGASIKEAIESSLTNYQSKAIMRNAIKKEVERVVSIEARKIVEGQQPLIQEIVKEEINQETLRRITSQMIEWLWREH